MIRSEICVCIGLRNKAKEEPPDEKLSCIDPPLLTLLYELFLRPFWLVLIYQHYNIP